MTPRQADAAGLDLPALVGVLSELALRAAAEIQQVAARPFDVSEKPDTSPVTEADERAEAIILAGLKAHYPDIPVVAEEEVAAGRIPDVSAGLFFLVDPLDGTKEFVKRRTDYTVNIALVENGVPVAGVVCAPARLAIWRGYSDGDTHRAETAGLSGTLEAGPWRPMACRDCAEPPVIVASRSHVTPETTAFLDRYPQSECVSVGSSLKFCLVAQGDADIYPRFGPTMEWDTAAGDAVLRAAGGMTRTLDGQPLAYGRHGGDKPFLNPFFIAALRANIVPQ